MKGRIRRKSHLAKKAVLHIKELLWNGATQSQVASIYGITQPAVSRIVTGDSHPNVPWPDGSRGPAPHHKPLIKDFENKSIEADQNLTTIYEEKSQEEFQEKLAEEFHEEKFQITSSDIQSAERNLIKETLIDPDIEAAVIKAIQQSLESEENDLIATIAHIESGETETVLPPSRVRPPCIPWRRIKRSLGTTPLFLFVEELDAGQKILARRLMGEAYALVPARMWHSLMITNVVLKSFKENGIDFAVFEEGEDE